MLNPWEIGALLVVVLVIFGPGKLPGIGQSLGKAIKNFKAGIDEKLETPENAQATQSAPAERIEQKPVNAQTDQTAQSTQTKVN
ncbi:MAG: twin-arginine translocase TatA/TatE family subunit [Pseudomonadota bacterium]